jgi:hypothetical protein
MGSGVSIDAIEKPSIEIQVHAPVRFADPMYEQFQFEELGIKPAAREVLMLAAREDGLFPITLEDPTGERTHAGDLKIFELKNLIEERYGIDHHTFTIHFEPEEITDQERAELGIGVHGEPFLDTQMIRETGITEGAVIHIMLYDPFVDDRQAMQLLFKSLKGLEKREGWNDIKNYTCPNDLNKMEGVTASGKEGKEEKWRVTHIDLHDFRLSGELPVKLPTKLKELILYTNKISGVLPPLPVTLELFRARSNDFTGSLPETFPRNLRFFDIAGNYIEGTLSDLEVHPLPKFLKRFWVHHNNLELTNSQEEEAQKQCPKCNFQFFDKPSTY